MARLIKYARANLVGTITPEEALRTAGARRFANMQPVLLDTNRFIYTRERALSSFERHGLNGNHDGWTEDELLRSFSTFVHAPRYVDHENTDPERAIGIVLDAIYHPLNDDPSSGWVETVSARDKARMAERVLHHLDGAPTLLEAVLDGRVTDVSMGCLVDESVCTVCGNVARDVHEYCDHVAMMKGAVMKVAHGSPLIHLGAKPGDPVVVGELNYGVTFFELSDITTQATYGGGGADPQAKILERVAQRRQSHGGWEGMLVIRDVESAAAGRQANDQGRVVHYNQAPNQDRGNDMSKNPKAKGAGWSDPSLKQMVAPEGNISQETQPKDYMTDGQQDKDQALFDQSQPKSEKSLDQKVVPSDANISQDQDDKDHPHKGDGKSAKKADFIETPSDPANMLGGKPSEVEDAENEQREEKFQDVAPKLDPEDRGEIKEEMDEDMEEEDSMPRRMESALRALPRAVRNHERVAEVLDSFNEHLAAAKDARQKVAAVKAKKSKDRHELDMHRSLDKAAACIRRVLAYGSEPADRGGNPQQMVDINDMEQGDPDANLLDQSQGTSEKSPAPATSDAEGTAQTERPDRPHEGDGKAAGRRVKAEQWDAAVDQMAERLARGEEYETVQREVFEQYGEPDGMSNRAARASAAGSGAKKTMPAPVPSRKRANEEPEEGESKEHEMAESPAEEKSEHMARKRTRANDVPDGNEYKLVEDDDAMEPAPAAGESSGKSTDPTTLKARGGRKTANEEEIDPNAGDSKSDISQGADAAAGNDAAIAKGTGPTKASPDTRAAIGDGDELIQLSSNRAAMMRRARARKTAADPGAEMEMGTTKTKASPSTKEISDGENMFQQEKTDSESQGNSIEAAPAVLSGHHMLATAVLRLRRTLKARTAECKRLRQLNEDYRMRTEAVTRAWKWDQCKKLAFMMRDKGFYRVDRETGRQRPIPEQTKVAYAEAKRFMRMSNDQIEDRMNIVADAPAPQTLVPEWRKEVRLPAEDSVKRAHTVPSHQVIARRAEDLDENLFVDDPRDGF